MKNPAGEGGACVFFVESGVYGAKTQGGMVWW